MASRSSALPNTNWNLDSEATTDSLELKEQTLIVADDGTAQDHVPTLTQPPALSRPPSFDDDATRALTAPDGGKEAWLVLVGAFTLTFFYCGFNYSFGVFQAVFEKQDLASTPVLVILGSIPIAVLAIVAIPVNAFVQWFGHRNSALLGSLLVGLSQFLAGFSISSLPGLFVLFGPVQGGGSCLLYLTTMPLLSQYFEKRRGFAIGLVASAAGIGGAFLSVITQEFISDYGIAWAYRINGLITLGACMPASVLMNPIEGRRAPNTARTRAHMLNSAVFGSVPFIMTCIASAIITFTLFTPSFFLASYAGSLGYTPQTGAQLSMGYNLASALGRIMFGLLADRLGGLNSLVLAVLLSGLSSLTIWPFATSIAPLAVFAVFSGITCGAWFALTPGVCAALLGNWLVGAGLAWQELFGSAGYLLGGPVAGFILDAAGGVSKGAKAFRPAMWYSGTATILAALFILLARLLYSTKLQRL